MSASSESNYSTDVAESFRRADSAAALYSTFEAELRRLGYERFYFANARRYQNGGGAAIANYSNFDSRFLDTVVQERLHDADLITDHAWESDRPLLWSQATARARDQTLSARYRRTIGAIVDFGYFAGVTLAAQHQSNGQFQQLYSVSLIQSSGAPAAEHDRGFHEVERRLQTLLNIMATKVDGVQLNRNYYDLNDIDRECLKRLMRGETVQQMADALFLSDRTTAYHLASLRKKLGARNNAHAVAIALLMEVL